MSYDLYLRDPVTNAELKVPAHLMTGPNIPCRMVNGQFVQVPSTEAYLNITYNYARYYYDAFPGAEDQGRFEEDMKQFPTISEEGGIRSLNGMTGAEAIPMLKEMIRRITAEYRLSDGSWKKSERENHYLTDNDTGKRVSSTAKMDFFFDKTRAGLDEKAAGKLADAKFTSHVETITVDEGDADGSYWDATAVKAIRPLYQLIALSQLRPDGVWSEES